MIEEREEQLSLFTLLPILDEDERDDAEFRAKDRAWAALIDVFEDRKQDDGLNYQILGNRIGRSRKQVQRWLSSSVNMTLSSVGLLAEGMDADLLIDIRKRQLGPHLPNHVHPSEAARAWVKYNTGSASVVHLLNPITHESPAKTGSVSTYSFKTDYHENA